MRFKWTGFYEEVANALSTYNNNRTPLVNWIKQTADKFELSYIQGKDLEDVDRLP